MASSEHVFCIIINVCDSHWLKSMEIYHPPKAPYKMLFWKHKELKHEKQKH